MSRAAEVRAVIVDHPEAPVPEDVAKGLARKLRGELCLLCLEMARTHFWLSRKPNLHPGDAQEHKQTSDSYVLAVVREANMSRGRDRDDGI